MHEVEKGYKSGIKDRAVSNTTREVGPWRVTYLYTAGSPVGLSRSLSFWLSGFLLETLVRSGPVQKPNSGGSVNSQPGLIAPI